MISEYEYDKFLESVIKKRKVTWSEIEDLFGEGFIDTEDFDKLLYKLDEEKVKVINDFFSKNDKNDLIFESYIDFDDPEMISRREEIGGKKELNPNNSLKEYLINAYLIMNYDVEFISVSYGISVEILKDWIFAYKHNYESSVPHCYFNTENVDIRMILPVSYGIHKNLYDMAYKNYMEEAVSMTNILNMSLISFLYIFVTKFQKI